MMDFKKLLTNKFQEVRDVLPKNQDMSKSGSFDLKNLDFYLLTLLVFFTPIFFLPKLVDWFDLPKAVLLLSGTLLCLVLWLLKAVIDRKLSFTKSIFVFPATILTVGFVVSALLSDNKFMSLAGDPVVMAGSFLLLILISQQVKNLKSFQSLVSALLLSAAVLSLLALVQNLAAFIPALKSLASSPFLVPTFSPVGSNLSQVVFLAIVFPLALGNYNNGRKLSIVLVFLTSLGLLLGAYNLFQVKPTLLSQAAGWRITTGTLGQSLPSAFFGAGPGNYVDAFTLFKPVEFNTTPFWNLRFTAGSNYYFYLLTTVGIIGLTGLLLLASRIIRLAQKRLESGLSTPLEKGLIGSLLVTLILFALLPMPVTAIATFFTLLGLLSAHFAITENATYVTVFTDALADFFLFRPAIFVLSLVLFLFVTVSLGRFVLADYHFAQSITAAQNNRATDTYNLQIKAISENPWNDNYRISYSQTNLALADALAATPNLTDQQKQTVVTLVQQAIREARLAAALSPKRAANWENLSVVYRGLINFAQGADEWAVASQSQAINFDPINPRLRLDLGAIYHSRKDLQSAVQVLTTAASLKPDYANAHYNLAQVLKELNFKDQALRELQLTASLICTNGQTPDCQRINSEIAGISPTVPTPIASPSAAPANLPKAKTNPPIKLASPTGELAQ